VSWEASSSEQGFIGMARLSTAPVIRAAGIVFVAAFVAAACASSTEDGEELPSAPGSATPAATVEQIEPSPPDVTVSGLAIYRGEEIEGAPEPLVDLDEIRSGGPPPDGIPSIDDPSFLSADEVDFLEENEPVLALTVNGESRAYPVQIMTWHEIVNDTIGGVPVAVTYCPLCNSALVYDRRVDDRVLEFGTSGLLWNSSLVMYDRQTETLWSHFTGAGIVGELTGEELATYAVATVAWGTWRDANPGGLVLSRDTGFDRSYGQNPYPGYDDVNSRPFLFEGEVDGRYTAMTRVVGVERGGAALAVPLASLQETGVIESGLAGDDLVVLWTAGTASSLDAVEIAAGADVGATGVFVPVVEGQQLTFSAVDGGTGDTFVDAETRSTWNVLGQSTDGPLTGAQLEAISHVDTFWFAWSAFRPDSAVIDS